MLLKNRPIPGIDEANYSYMLRLAIANGQKKTKYIFGLCGLTFRYFSPNLFYEDELLCGALEKIISKEFYNKSNFFLQVKRDEEANQIKIFNKIIPGYLLERYKVKVCPNCINENKYVSSLWQLVNVTSCTYHKCILIEKCPSCQETLRWNENLLDGCSCGFKWNMNDDIDKEVNEEGLLSQIKYKKFGCIEKLDEGFNTLSNDFLELDYTEISILLILIARSLAKRVEYWSMYHLSQLDNSEIHRIFNDSLTVFKDWPNNYIIYLKGIQTSSKIIRHKGKNTVKHDIVMSLSEFGKFYKKLYDTIFDAPCFKFVRDAFENFLVKEWKHGSLKQFRKIDLTKYERIMMTPKRAPLSAI